MSSARAFLITTALGMFAGCATSYHEMGITGGFAETRLAPEVYRVTFEGNGYSDPVRVQDFAMLQAAELALARGFAHFVLINAQDWNRYILSNDELIAKPRSGVMVRLVRGQPAGAFDAAFLARSLRAKYRIGSN